jgi:glycosyltransferase involved in cell wall biosynthesis
MKGDGLLVSVCIPTRDRRERVLLALDSLAGQTLGPGRFEVVVADDGSRDGTVEALREAQAAGRWPFPLRLLELAPGGAAAARNAAAAEARAEVLAFLDSDVLADPSWLAAGLSAFSGDGAVDAVEGRTEVRSPDGITPFTPQTQNLRGGRYPSCNLFVRRGAFQAVSGFDTAFSGTFFPFREDTDFAFRLLDAGSRIAFAEAAVVDHPPTDGRLLTPLRQARRYLLEPLLRRKHPGRYRGEVDVHRLGGLRVARPRQKVYAANAALAAAAAAAWALGAPAGWTAAGAGGWALTYLLVLSAHRPWRARSAREALAVPLIAAAVPFVYAFSVLEGRLRLFLGRRAASLTEGGPEQGPRPPAASAASSCIRSVRG